MQRDNAAWLKDLRSTGEQQSSALKYLREVLMRILPVALSRWLEIDDPHFNTLIEDITQETLLKVLDRLDQFEERSKFTTWVYAIAVRIGLSELRKKKWQEVSLDAINEDHGEVNLPSITHATPKNSPEITVAQANAFSLVMAAMQQKLTPYQFNVMSALILEDIPLEVLAHRLGKGRNTLYKVIHDARLKLKQHLEDSGHPPDELLALFNR
jgi:RNA polymerase sigma-70 factor, ECF subfamily